MITAKITKGAGLSKQFKDSIPNIQSGVQQEIMSLAVKLTGLVVRKLNGEVLKVFHGRLWRSIHPEWQFRVGYSGATVGTNVEYAAIHEYGGVIQMPAKLHQMYFKAYQDGSLKKGFAKKKASNFMMEKQGKAYEIHMPERSFLRSSLREMNPEIQQRLLAEITKELKAIK